MYGHKSVVSDSPYLAYLLTASVSEKALTCFRISSPLFLFLQFASINRSEATVQFARIIPDFASEIVPYDGVIPNRLESRC